MPRFPKEPRFGAAAAAYGAFVVYGSLVPLAWRPRPFAEAWAAFLQVRYLDLGIASRADWVANILLYIPLAFLLSGALSRHARRGGALLLAFLGCIALALAVEFTQLYFPPRTVSLNDLVAEFIGAAIGIALWHGAGGQLVALWRQMQFGGRQGTRALIVLYAAAYLALALFPYDFVVSGAELAHKLTMPGRSAWFLAQGCGGTLACGSKLVAEMLAVAPLGVLLGMLAAPGRPPSVARAFGWGLLLGMVIEGLQTFLASGVGQGASIFSRGLGMALGHSLYRSFRREWLLEYRARIRAMLLLALPVYGILLLALNGFFSARLQGLREAQAKLAEVRFLPFYYHYFTSETQAMHSLLVHAGAYAPVGVAVWLLRGQAGPAQGLAALAALLAATSMEALKLFLEGRKPDPTNVLIAAAAAALACFVAERLATRGAARPIDTKVARAPSARPGRIAVAGLLVATVAALAGWGLAMQPAERYVDESRLAQLPAPEALPPAILPGFRMLHPRLPAPSGLDRAVLKSRNPAFLDNVRRDARAGEGDLQSAVMQEVLEPGSVRLDVLHRRLMALKVTWRGHEQVKPLALAYDWLYGHWSDAQRAELREKLVDGCEYLINLIRKDRLSPYNVILYNAPFQALMACSIALYRDDPRADAIMAFTDDLWKNRVLPVWRQVMGKNGGWHEGGEYVGIGIGQAIYQVPAMWRQATGEDLFAAEPGIRGFLDFLVYRTRPDGTHLRWGDGAWFDRLVPDATALALEFRHAAAYSLRPPAKAPAPSGWPWGPLTDASLIDASAASRLPLARHFDGLGLVVARSDWSPQATYVTFNAGDNYWSHSHLGQGGFTIYKGGPLAIDSGLYGPAYGSDHHMNYTYQTIAHNTITVTDPEDNVPAPGKEKPRPIANDGGQRRVGSGWGVEAAPLDRAEWEAKRDIYHTGKIERFLEADGIVVAVADITPAYTSRRSGEGTFSHRTRRVERFWRVFGYDRVNDAVVVFDQVVATEASFRKRWLLHTLQAPRIAGKEFEVSVPALDRRGRDGGRLHAAVLLPKQAVLNAIGGRGLEFFVDDRNYDEGGKVHEAMKKRAANGPEPGAWRVEVIPAQDTKEDLFLVVLLPAALGAKPSPEVRYLESGNRVGAQISTPARTTRWWFEKGRNTVQVDVVEAGGAITQHRAEGRSSAPASPRGWLVRLKEGP